jgi:hypothetical protein
MKIARIPQVFPTAISQRAIDEQRRSESGQVAPSNAAQGMNCHPLADDALKIEPHRGWVARHFHKP